MVLKQQRQHSEMCWQITQFSLHISAPKYRQESLIEYSPRRMTTISSLAAAATIGIGCNRLQSSTNALKMEWTFFEMIIIWMLQTELDPFCGFSGYLIGHISSSFESTVWLSVFAFGMYTIWVNTNEKLMRSANVTPRAINITAVKTYRCCTTIHMQIVFNFSLFLAQIV